MNLKPQIYVLFHDEDTWLRFLSTSLNILIIYHRACYMPNFAWG